MPPQHARLTTGNQGLLTGPLTIRTDGYRHSDAPPSRRGGEVSWPVVASVHGWVMVIWEGLSGDASKAVLSKRHPHSYALNPRTRSSLQTEQLAVFFVSRFLFLPPRAGPLTKRGKTITVHSISKRKSDAG